MGAKIKDSSGNVFEDLGIPNPEEALSKAKIMSQMHKIVKKRGLSQAQLAKLLKITPIRASLMLRGHLNNFSLDSLRRFLNNLEKNL
jgi:predicted XRE-type DNA-binding protein